MDHLSPDDVVRLLEEQGGAGRQRFERSDIPDRTALLCHALGRAASSRVREILCSMLASVADPTALPCLLEALDDPDGGVIAAASDAIGNSAYQQPLADPLRQMLGTRLLALAEDPTRDVAVRTAAIYALGLMNFVPSSPFLLAALSDPAPEVRWGAAEALAHIGDREAIPTVRSRLEEETHERVQAYLTAALAALTETRS